jgi:phage baseplate assembly protein W
MGYQIVSADQIVTGTTGLGISYTSDGTKIFTATRTDLQIARENLINLLLTKKGEIIMEPTLGSDLLYVLFEPNVDNLKDVVVELITEPVEYWLPYIILDNIEVETSETNPDLTNSIRVSITFSVNEAETDSISLLATDTGTLTVE